MVDELRRQAPLLEVSGLSIEYGTAGRPVVAVDNVSFTVGRGEVFGLAGESGSGKSTLAYGLLRLLRSPACITQGRVVLKGRDVLAMSEAELLRVRWREASLVFQSAMNALNPVLSIGEQLSDVIVSHLRVSRTEALERAAELLRLVGMDSGRLRSFPHQLSGGMRQRVVIAIALALEPPLIIMDEPTTALDVVVQKEILHQVQELKERLGLAIVFITHDLSLLLEISTRVGVLYAGRMVENAPVEAFLNGPQHPYSQGLLNSFPLVGGPRRRLTGIGGSPPDMQKPPAGCRFHPRCEQAVSACLRIAPPVKTLRHGHAAACHLLDTAPAVTGVK